MTDENAGRQDAQRRADRIRAFRAEWQQLEKEGALSLSREQRDLLEQHLETTLLDLRSRFDIDTSEREKQASWGMRIASTLGALALGTAVVLFFYQIWGMIPVSAQVLLLVAAPLASLAAAEFMSRRETAPYFTSLIAMVAFAAFILDLNVIAAIFNLTPTPNALLAWALFAGALAYRFGLRLLLAAGLICGGGWVAALLTMAAGGWWAELFQRLETVLMAGLLVAVAPRRPVFAATHRLVGLLAVFLAMLFLSFEGHDSFFGLYHSTVEKLYQVGGMAAAAGAIWAGIRRGWNDTVNLGASFFVVFLYVRLVDWWWDWMPKFLFFLIVGLISIGLLLAFRRLRARWMEARP